MTELVRVAFKSPNKGLIRYVFVCEAHEFEYPITMGKAVEISRERTEILRPCHICGFRYRNGDPWSHVEAPLEHYVATTDEFDLYVHIEKTIWWHIESSAGTVAEGRATTVQRAKDRAMNCIPHLLNLKKITEDES